MLSMASYRSFQQVFESITSVTHACYVKGWGKKGGGQLGHKSSEESE